MSAGGIAGTQGPGLSGTLRPPGDESGGRDPGSTGRGGAGEGRPRDTAAGTGGQDGRRSLAGGETLRRADRFAAVLDGALNAPPAASVSTPRATEPPAEPVVLEALTGPVAGPVIHAPAPPPSLPLLPAGSAGAEAVAAITQRVEAEIRAADSAGLLNGSGPGAAVLRLQLDLGRSALGVTQLRIELGPQGLVLVLVVPPGMAAHDLPQAAQVLARSLTARHPHRAVRVDIRSDSAEAETAAPVAAFDPLQPWSARS